MKHDTICTCEDCTMEKGMRRLLDESVPTMRRRDAILAEQGVDIDTGTPEQILAAWEQAEKEEGSVISSAASLLGRKGGLAKTKLKASTARENGKKGGRPKKDK